MLIVPNHHVIVPKTEDRTIYLDTIVTDPECRRQAHVQHLTVSNANVVQLDFQPISDQWIELYLDGYRILNYRYPTYETQYATYETYNMAANNTIRFANAITGNLTIVCDTLAYPKSETLTQANISGVTVNFDNVQSYDVYEKRFTPSRYPMPSLGLRNSLMRIRIGDAHYSEPVILSQPCYGFVRLSRDRRSIVYTPRLGYQGWDVFGYTLMSQHGQMGKPAGITIKTYGDDLRYQWSANLDASNSFMSIRDFKHTYIAALGGKSITIEFYYFTREVSGQHNYRVGVFGQYRPTPKAGRLAVYLQGTSATSSQVVVLQFTVSGFTVAGDPVFSDYKLSSRARLSQNRWHHVTIQINAGNPANTQVSMFLDGYRENFYNNDFTAQTVESGDYYFIGGVNDLENSQYLNGYLSNFRIMANTLVYSGDRIQVPQRPLANIANVRILTASTGIQDPESVHDVSDFSRILKHGNVKMVETGPFSPVVLTSQIREVMHGDVFRITTASDYICKYTTVPWNINANISVGTINAGYVGANIPSLTISHLDELDRVFSTSGQFSGNFIIDDIDQVEITVDTHSNLMTTRRRFDFALDQYPLMIETIDVLADPDGLVLDIAATNDGFARDLVNFNHGQLTSIGAYNPSLSGYFNFNGTTDIITGQHNKAIDTRSDMSCTVWFRTTLGSANKVRLFGKGLAGNVTYAISYLTSTNTIYYERDHDEGTFSVEHNISSSMLSNWYQVTAVTQGYEHKLYLNAQLVAQGNVEMQPYKTNSLGYTLGSSGGIDRHNGQISLVKLYNRALSGAEILADFNQYRGRYGL